MGTCHMVHMDHFHIFQKLFSKVKTENKFFIESNPVTSNREILEYYTDHKPFPLVLSPSYVSLQPTVN